MDEAIDVLRLALHRSGEDPQTGPDVRLALKALRFSGIPAEAIRGFWEGASGDHEIGQQQSMNAALNRIVLFKTGKLPR